jgi:hypothetical protein
MGFGDNAKAALMTRGLAEITRLGLKLGAKPETFAGLTGVGDLIVTCTSMHSRNRRCGIMIGEGIAPDEATKRVGMVVEGMFTTDMPLSVMTKLLTSEISDLDNWEIFSIAVTGKNGTDYNWSSGGKAYVMYPDESVAQAAEMMLRVMADEVLTAENSP